AVRIIIGVEVTAGPLPKQGELRLGQADMLPRCLRRWDVHRVPIQPGKRLRRPGVTVEDPEPIDDGPAHLAVVWIVLRQPSKPVGGREIVRTTPSESARIPGIDPLQVGETRKDGEDVMGKGGSM